jgi:hypothetical protein
MNNNRTPKLLHRFAAAATALLIVGSGVALGAAPASATTPSQWAAGWLTRSANESVTSWSTTGAKPAITGHSMGMWTVTFPGITGGFGVPAVTPGNQYLGGSCTIESYGVISGNVDITFFCTDRDGTAVESDFTVSYTSIPGATEGWVKADRPARVGSYTPVAQYDASGGQVSVSHYPNAPGYYAVYFPGFTSAPNFGSAIATALGSAGQCAPAQELWDDHVVLDVYCTDRNGAPADMEFVAHFVGKRGLLATPAPKSGWATDSNLALGKTTITKNVRYTSNNKNVVVNHTAKGTFIFTFKGLAGSTSRGAHAASVSPKALCGAVASASGADAVATVKCVDAEGKPADTVVTANIFGN